MMISPPHHCPKLFPIWQVLIQSRARGRLVAPGADNTHTPHCHHCLSHCQPLPAIAINTLLPSFPSLPIVIITIFALLSSLSSSPIFTTIIALLPYFCTDMSADGFGFCHSIGLLLPAGSVAQHNRCTSQLMTALYIKGRGKKGFFSSYILYHQSTCSLIVVLFLGSPMMPQYLSIGKDLLW